MDITLCPITGEKIIAITNRGVTRMSNYSEVWFDLTDGSKMRLQISVNGKKNLTEKILDEVFLNIKKEMENSTRSKALPAETMERYLEKIKNLDYKKVFDKKNIYIEKI